MNEKLIAAVGERASVIIFHASGVTTRAVENTEEAEKAVISLANEGYKVIFLSEVYYIGLPDLMEKYREYPYPAIIPIPDRSGEKGVGAQKIIDNMERAIGTNIFDK
jgi:V/A-type H+-transporting ATPase subunit F